MNIEDLPLEEAQLLAEQLHAHAKARGEVYTRADRTAFIEKYGVDPFLGQPE